MIKIAFRKDKIISGASKEPKNPFRAKVHRLLRSSLKRTHPYAVILKYNLLGFSLLGSQADSTFTGEFLFFFRAKWQPPTHTFLDLSRVPPHERLFNGPVTSVRDG